jgi:carboxyl-terminal processing protease
MIVPSDFVPRPPEAAGGARRSPEADASSPAWTPQPSGHAPSSAPARSSVSLPPGQGWIPLPPVLSPRRSSRAPQLFATLVAVVLVFSLGYIAGAASVPGTQSSAAPATAGANPSGSAPPAVAGATLPPDAPADFGVFWEALKLVRDNFVDPSKATDQNLTWGAIRGMIDALGDTEHSVFLTPDEVQADQDALSGKVSGIGVVIDNSGDLPVVVSVIPGSPAATAGLRAGDVITAVDGAQTQGLSSDDVVGRIRGQAGSTVVLTIRHSGDAQTTDVSIVRADVSIPAATWGIVPATTIGDVHMLQFSSGSGDATRAAIQSAIGAGATSLVLDLRGNPGGYVPEAVELASQFLTSGAVVYQEKNRAGDVDPVPANPGGIALDLPLVVLVDRGTASAAEIVAGAIQGNQRGQVVGETTFGTGTVLNTYSLSDGSAIRLGVIEWLTPTGDTIFAKGITPDVQVALPSNGTALEPDQLNAMSPDDFAAATDTQLQKAVDLLAP